MDSSIKLVAVAGQSRDVVRVVAQVEHPDGEYLQSWVMRWTRQDGKWVKFQVRWIATSIAVIDAPVLEVVALGPEGHVLLLDRQGSREEFPGGDADSMLANGFMREVRRVSSTFVACGMGRQVYRRDNGGSWRAIHAGVLAPPDEAVPVGFNSVHGKDPESLVAVGFLGEIWRLSGVSWTREDSPTNVTLHKVLFTPGAVEYVGGKAGTLLRGTQGRWQLIPQSGIDDDIRDLAWHEGRLLAVAGERLLSLRDGNQLEPLERQPPGGCTQVSSAGGVLWATGPANIAYTDDMENWHDITP